MDEFEKTIEEIKIFWISASSTDEYIKRCYQIIFKYCTTKYVFDQSELKIYKKYKIPEGESESQIIESKDLRYIFILLCALKSNEIFELINFTFLPTDFPSLTEKSILKEVEITKRLLN